MKRMNASQPKTAQHVRSRYALRAASARKAEADLGEPTIEPATFTIAQFASYLQISRNHAYTLARIPGKLPMVQAGRRRLVNRIRLEALLAAGELSWTPDDLRLYRERAPRRR